MYRTLLRSAFATALLSGALAAVPVNLQASPAAKRIGFEDLKRIQAASNDDGGNAGETSIELNGFMLPADR
jgi:Skp family chaperone for outer membrane proteins